MDDLAKLRKEIDLIDKDLIRLFEKRMNIVLKVAEYKRKNNIPILNKEREQDVINKNISHVENQDFKEPLGKILNYMMKVSKEIQEQKIQNDKL